MTSILIVRHGNTFDPGETPLRIGVKTDIPLSKSGITQAEQLSAYIAHYHSNIDAIYSSHLQRTYQTADIILDKLNPNLKIEKNDIFNEVDYGVDEGKTDQEIIARIGKDALHAWDELAIVPNGWFIQPKKIIASWQTFADDIKKTYPTGTVLVVTSNGIARFAPQLTGDMASFQKNYTIKMKTGAISHLVHEGEQWCIKYWNRRP